MACFGAFFACLYCVGMVFNSIASRLHKVGVPFVERLKYHNGNVALMEWSRSNVFLLRQIGLDWRTLYGKEGPAVHLGATVRELLAKAKLPNMVLEPFWACGVLALFLSIFQTPLSEVFCCFEVIFLEYRQRYVLPVVTSFGWLQRW